MTKKSEQVYMCKECGLKYRKKELAEKCEKWCKEHKSCNLEITRYAINKNIPKIKKKFEKLAVEGGIIGFMASGILSFLGLTGLCCSPFVLAFFGFFGISSGMFLMTYNWLFLFLAVIFIIFIMYKAKNRVIKK